ncbi:MAG: dihydrolipoyllysine-residue acetyltransferase [Pseudomonadales bacterium]|jgi:pyruvate dehydrogenase E2 component (dihydrolipoamide acetyltransferase)|nr:dihydrolipoyllysine-residue acetyltransferase [Pseudomonadales bacterium]
MSIETVRIPDIGDASEVEVIELCVAEGDRVAVDDALVVIESDKASLEVPSPVAGVVRALKLKVGDRCGEGDAVAEVETEAAGKDGGSEGDDGAGASATDAEEKQAAAEDRQEAPARGEEPEDAGEPEGGTRIVDVTVPDVGDASDVAVVEVMVAAGDTVEADDGLVALESDKATMEVPAPVGGRVVSVEVGEGDAVSEGTLVARIETREAGGGDGGDASGAARKSGEAEQKSSGAPEPEPTQEAAPRERASAPAAAGEERDAAPAEGGAAVYAGPAVRRLARELGVDLRRVEGSGARGRIVKEDVHGHVKRALSGGAGAGGPAAGGAGIPPIPAVDFSRFGEVERQPLSRIMRTGAANLHRSWLNVPHVTQHDEVDVTELEAFRRSLKGEAEQRGTKLTPLPFLMKAAAAALAEFPRVNGSFDPDGEHYVLKRYCHVGFAVDTPDGLLVPVVRDVDRKGIWTLAEEIADLSERARKQRLKPDEMRGGCFSISSLGAIGGTAFTPIVNAPEVAILGVSRLTRKPVWDGEGFVPRELLPLSLSYDHRALNGAEAGRFLTAYGRLLGDLRRLLL